MKIKEVRSQNILATYKNECECTRIKNGQGETSAEYCIFFCQTTHNLNFFWFSVGNWCSFISQYSISKGNSFAVSTNIFTSFIPMYLNLNLIFFVILIFALTFDFYFAAKLNIISLKGKNLIHILFIAFISIGLLIAIKGALL